MGILYFTRNHFKENLIIKPIYFDYILNMFIPLWIFRHRLSPVASTHPGPKGDELENTLEGEAHGEGEVHVAEDVGEEQRSPVVLRGNKASSSPVARYNDGYRSAPSSSEESC